VQKALSRIGVSQIRQAILNMAVIDNFHTNNKNDRLNSELFWEHSIATGLIAAGITRMRHGEDRAIDRAFTIGLLHDVARMVFAENVGAMYGQVLDAASRCYLPLEQVESRMLLANHAELIEGLLKAWKFPERLIAPIAMHHLSAADIRTRAPDIIDEVCTLALADRFAHALLLGSSGNECQYPTAEFIEVLELQTEAMAYIKEQIPEQVVELKAAMMQSCAPTAPMDYRQIVLKSIRRSIASQCRDH
jgi:HD-like signal output (HDOD) protein